MVIKTQKPSHPDGTFTIRGVTSGHTIEKVYPFSFPNFAKVILLDEYKIRQSKLYYIREKVGKDAKFKSVIPADRKELNLQDLAEQERDNLIAAAQPEIVEEVVEAPVVEEAPVETKVEEVKEEVVETPAVEETVEAPAVEEAPVEQVEETTEETPAEEKEKEEKTE